MTDSSSNLVTIDNYTFMVVNKTLLYSSDDDIELRKIVENLFSWGDIHYRDEDQKINIFHECWSIGLIGWIDDIEIFTLYLDMNYINPEHIKNISYCVHSN